ncbi:hypothetical protein LTLLF_115950 [Microtus ochrogaster]|uniref:Heterogeneous nuclear ribonucleoprotein A1/A2 C-terminal domain-containing protein n=1 Tax=Microtus ochrogaster TaxID=79684 RepID=A0A8J6GXC3_MICOH|nr:hypothetical protein LTLLF_115950 [Microtus ochrogaster]
MALVAAMMVVDMVVVGMAVMNSVMMEAVWVVGGSYNDFGNYNNQSSVFGPMKETLEAEALAFMVAEASTLLNHETKVALVVTAAAAMAVAGGSNYSQETKLSRRGEPEKCQGSYRSQQICELSQAQWWLGLAATKKP